LTLSRVVPDPMIALYGDIPPLLSGAYDTKFAVSGCIGSDWRWLCKDTAMTGFTWHYPARMLPNGTTLLLVWVFVEGNGSR
jgi:hypothetical protein